MFICYEVVINYLRLTLPIKMFRLTSTIDHDETKVNCILNTFKQI